MGFCSEMCLWGQCNMGGSGLEKGIQDTRTSSWEKRSRRKQTQVSSKTWGVRTSTLLTNRNCYKAKLMEKQNYPFLLERILIKMMHLKWCLSLEWSFNLVRELRTHLEYFYFQFIPFLYGNYLIHCSFSGIQIILNNKGVFFWPYFVTYSLAQGGGLKP